MVSEKSDDCAVGCDHRRFAPSALGMRAVATGGPCEKTRRVATGLADLAQELNVQLNCSTKDAPLEIVADETQLGVAIHAVVKNAIEADSDGGKVAVQVREFMTDDKPCVEVVVRDDGPG